MNKVVYEKQLESVEEQKIDNSIFRKKSNAKTFPGWMVSRMKKARDEKNLDVLALLYAIYQKYVEFESSEKVLLKGWKGKSDIKIITKPDYFIVSTFQKKDQDSKPEAVRREIPKKEVNLIISCINSLKSDKNKIPTREIGEFAYKQPWDDIFSNRSLHTQLNLIFRILDYYKVIRYRGGKTTVLNPVREIQEVLK